MIRSYGTARYDATPGGKGQWILKPEPQVAIRLKRVFARIIGHGELCLSDTPEVCRELQWFFQRYPMDLDPASRDHLRDGADEFRRRETMVASVLNGTYRPREFKLEVPLRSYQQVAADLVLRLGGLLLGDDVGVGKTATAIGMISDPRARPALVVTLTALPRQWKAEIERFLPGVRIHILESKAPYDIGQRVAGRKRQRSIFDLAEGELPDVIISNYVKLEGWADDLAGQVNGLVLDEVQDLRHPGTGKYRAAKHIAGQAAYRIGLTATPIHNYGSEFYHVLEILCPGGLGTHREFTTEWCGDHVDDKGRALITDERAFGTYIRGTGAFLRRTREECGIELPEMNRIPFELDASSKDLDRMAPAAVELAKMILATGGKGLDKLQATQEFDVMLRKYTGISKAPAVADLVRMILEGGEPRVLLFGWHHDVYDIWREKLKDMGIVFFTGKEGDRAKQASYDAFTKGDARVLAMSLRAGAGLNGLQGACNVAVAGELDWSPAIHIQNDGRLWRFGQKNRVTSYFPYATFGSDPVILDVLGVKRQQLVGVIDPDAPLVESQQVDPKRIFRLAQAYMDARGAA